MEYLKQKLKQKHISQNELAKRTGITRTTINQYINGKRKLNRLDHIYNIQMALGLSMNKFIKEILK